MKETLLLTKVFFNSSVGFSSKKKKRGSSILFLILLGALFALALGGLYILLPRILPVDLPKHSFVILSLVVVSFLGFIINFFSMYTVLFKAKDFEFLVSSPLKRSSIITAKLLSMFLFTFVIDGIGMLPIIIIYMIKGGTAVGLLCAVVGTIFAGVVPLLVSTLVGALVGILTVKIKNGEVITVIVYIAFFIGFTTALSLSLSSSSILLNADRILPYYRFLSNSIMNDNALGVLYFSLINIAAIIVVIIFTSLIYFPINKAKINNGDGAYKSVKEKGNTSTSRLLFRKEIKMVIKNPLFVLTTYAMPVIIFVLGIISVGFLGKGFIGRDADSLNKIIFNLKYFQPAFCVLVGSACVPTFASFSMEGRDNLEQLFVYPLDKKAIIRAKIKASIIPLSIIFIVTNFILVLIFAIIRGLTTIDIWIWLSIMIFPILATISGTLIGTLCGLKWIKLDFVDANDILKKSKSSVMTFLFGGLLNLSIFGIYFALSFTLKNIPYLGFLIAVVAEIIAITILAIAVKKNSLKMLEKALIN